MGKIFSEVKRAYLAGLIDGDGAIMASIEHHNGKRFKIRVRVSVKVTSSSKEDVVWLKKITNVGYTRTNRRTYEWIVRDQSDAQYILLSIVPYVRTKRKQTELALKILQGSFDEKCKDSLYKKACLADTLSSFNIRSKNRRKNYAIMVQENISRND